MKRASAALDATDPSLWFKQELEQTFALPSDQRAHELMLLCKSYIEQHPELSEPYVTLAFLALQAQCPEEAQRFLKQALQRAPFDRRLQQIYKQIKK